VAARSVKIFPPTRIQSSLAVEIRFVAALSGTHFYDNHLLTLNADSKGSAKSLKRRSNSILAGTFVDF
jgi:hypothetical protein